MAWDIALRPLPLFMFFQILSHFFSHSSFSSIKLRFLSSAILRADKSLYSWLNHHGIDALWPFQQLLNTLSKCTVWELVCSIQRSPREHSKVANIRRNVTWKYEVCNTSGFKSLRCNCDIGFPIQQCPFVASPCKKKWDLSIHSVGFSQIPKDLEIWI